MFHAGGGWCSYVGFEWARASGSQSRFGGIRNADLWKGALGEDTVVEFVSDDAG